MDIKEILRAKREEVLSTAAKHMARNMRIFGSAVRAKAKPNSSKPDGQVLHYNKCIAADFRRYTDFQPENHKGWGLTKLHTW